LWGSNEGLGSILNYSQAFPDPARHISKIKSKVVLYSKIFSKIRWGNLPLKGAINGNSLAIVLQNVLVLIMKKGAM
jgi:hypothetical protein